MSRQRSGKKTPAKVQVFYFEKKQAGRVARPTRTLDGPRADADEPLPDRPARPRPTPSPRRTPSRSTRRARVTRDG